MVGYVALIGSAVVYAVGIVAQSVAARRAVRKATVDPGLLVRLAGDPIYLLGFGAQVLGFVLVYIARGTLPLYLVQAGASSSVALAVLIGCVLLGWRASRAEVAVLAVIAAGLVLLSLASVPSVSTGISVQSGVVLAAVLALTAVAAVPAWRLSNAVLLGVLAGVAFTVLAVASRPLAAGPLTDLPRHPLAWLMVASAVVGQTLLAAALQRGSTASTVASMDATTVVLASVAGLTILGDQVSDGRGWFVVAGLTLVVAGIVIMASVSRTGAGTATVPEPDIDSAREVAA